MEPRKHESSAEMHGDARRVLDALVVALAASGFRVERRTGSEVELARSMSLGSHHQPIVGASRIVASASNRRLVITAELGGFEQMRRLLLFLPLTMFAVFAIVFGVVLPIAHPERFSERGWILLVPIVPMFVIFLLIAVVLRPLVSRKLEKATKAALDALATSIASIGADG